MTSAVKITGDKEIAAKLDRLRVQVPKQVGAALLKEGERLMFLSKSKFAPVDLGTLRASGFVKGPFVENDKFTVVLGYGGAAASYAIIQHENMRYRHTVGEAKFLERPVMQARTSIPSRIARGVKIR